MSEPEALKGLNRTGLGGNLPPEPIDPPSLQDQLAADHADLVKRIDELMALAQKAPLEVKDEETFKPLSDLLKAGRVAIQMSEAARKIENEESRKRTATIDAWFKNPAEKLTTLMKAVKERTDAYLEEKKAKEEKLRQAAAAEKVRIAKERAEDALWADALGELAFYNSRKAQEAVIEARLKKEAAARRADHLRDRGKRLKALELYMATRRQRREADLERQAEIARKAAQDERERLEAEGDRRLALEAEDARRAQEAARLVEARKRNEEALALAKTETTAARRQETSLGTKAEKLEAQGEEHADQAVELSDEAGRLGKRAERAERHANASPAAMSRTRSEMGTTSSISKSWKMTSLDRNVVDLNLLRGFLHPDAVEVAARGYMMAHRNDPGGPVLEGAVFEQLEEGVYR